MKRLLNRRSRKNPLRLLLDKKAEGQGQIEFIISVTTVMFVIFWTWEVILAVYTYNVLSDAAKEGVRYAIVHGSNNILCSGPAPSGGCPTGTATATLCDGSTISGTDTAGANIVTTVKCYAGLSLQNSGNISGMTVTVGYPAGVNSAPNEVNVTVHYQYVPFLALPVTPMLNVASSGRIVN